MITVDIVNNTQVESASVYATGHGIPGTTGGGSPQALNVLGPQGRFVQAAVLMASVACTGTTATITTAVANQVAANQTVFVSGVSVPGYNGVFTVTGVNSTTEFTYSVPAPGNLENGSGGAVYLPELISSQTIVAAVGVSGIVTVSLDGAANIPLNSPIFLSGITGTGVGWNGVWAVSQNPWSNPALASYQFQIEISGAGGSATVPANSTVQIVALTPIGLTNLPQNPNTYNPCVLLDQNVAGFSAQLVVMVTPGSEAPFPLGITPTTANLSNLAIPPFAIGEQAGNSVADIVEFYYAGSGTSTFDVSQVDGFALPLTLQASPVASGPSQVGVNPALAGINRQGIGEAFQAFIQNEPADVATIGLFGRLLYDGPVDVNPLTVAPPSTTGKALTNVNLAQWQGASVMATAAAAHGLVPEQAINVSGAGTPYDGSFVVGDTGLTDPSLNGNQFTYNVPTIPSGSPSGTVTPTDSGVIATSTVNLVVQVTSGTAPSPGTAVQLSGVAAAFDGPYTVLPLPAVAGLPTSAAYLATTSGQNFTPGSTSGGGILGVPVFVAPPSVPLGQFYGIAAPKDWLANQTVATANSDPMAAWWDTTIDAFFAAGNYLQVAIGATTSYTGVCNATLAFDFYPGLSTSGTPSFSIAKPAPSGGQSERLANATWVWAQAGIPANQQGTVWDQIVQAFCRGVAMDGVLTSVPTTTGQSNAAWTNTANWYTEHTSASFPNFTSRYCPFSKFLHYGTLQGGTDRTGSSSIYLQNLAYGFSEDETPLGADGSAISTGVPSKMDGTIPDGAAMTLIVGPFPLPPPPVTAQGIAVMESGVVLEVVVINPGAGYTSPPAVTITPPNNGMPATAFATIVNGQVIKVTMTNQGSGYDFGPQVTFALPVG
jgi:hypothetical protein